MDDERAFWGSLFCMDKGKEVVDVLYEQEWPKRKRHVVQ